VIIVDYLKKNVKKKRK